ncbi:unnamed protein product, partial [Prorocentrum cordatum]
MVELDVRLSKLGSDPRVADYLNFKGMVNIGQFAGLADSKADSVVGICVPAGLDGTDRPLCQPVKAAWQETEALVAGELDLIWKGKGGGWDDPVDPEVREKRTASFVGHYHIRLPAHLMGSDALAGRLVRALNSEAGISASGGGASAQNSDDSSGTQTAVGFMYKHRVLMNTLALAAAPDWASADWSVLLDYHEWVVLKLFERKNGRKPTVDAVMEADRQMRPKWKSLTEAVQTCRAEWVSLFSGLHSDRSGAVDGPQQAPPKKARVGLPRVESVGGKQVRAFYNEGKCTYGKKCKYLH